MSLDRATLASAVAAQGSVVRVVVAEVLGSAPREVGAAMLVWPGGQEGTIGGGALEYEAAAQAREMLARGEARASRKALLGPDLGQCCGGAVTLLFEAWDADALAALTDTLHARPVDDGASQTPPLAVVRLRAQARRSGARPSPRLVEGWFVEPLSATRAPVWIWGAGHVGRALVETLAPHPGLALTWLDTGADRFPATIPAGVTHRSAPDLAAAAADAPANAHHIVLTYSHAFDLALCDALLGHGFAGLGLIGSATKWARFRARLGQMGHRPDAIARIRCPVGEKRLGKHPQAIAVGVAYGLLMELAQNEAERPAPGDEGNGDDRRALDA
ncbi:xanthine dehydrogenase accessory protein XdhC [Sinisalibacter lacisalsi]|uniref:Xanthine dehydrogenase accessory protein XdhC n=1 Tax=Sinisalibacter lacisalsi TaxID=1526570 RepID=A0ABQ1QXC1_9RHOB|nr:xanthine dehydrogenase accessory protein XdhC [Sinisalibacter lacisalsi]GGD46768.1 xanthine dehydrogenase accessory protein XdhC [Sinisalibacter lacisalsi]